MTDAANIFKLIYVSTATKLYSVEELRKILKVARANNEKLGISGIMLYGNGVFIQLLEGEKETVENLFSKIASDQKHHSVIVLSREMAVERDFPAWSMGFKRYNQELDLEEIKSFSEIVENKQAFSELLDRVSIRVKLLMDTFRHAAGLQRYII